MWTPTLLFGVFTLCRIVAVTFSQEATSAASEPEAPVGTLAYIQLEVDAVGMVTKEPEEVITSGLVKMNPTAPEVLVPVELVTPQPTPPPTLPPGEDIVHGDCGGDVSNCDTSPTAGPVGTTEAPIQVAPGGTDGTQSTEELVTSALEGATRSQTVTSAIEEATHSQPKAAETTSVGASVSPPEVKDTTVVTERVTEEVTTTSRITTTLRTWPADDPCNVGNHKVLADRRRHFTQTLEKGTEPLSDSELVTGWYGFDYKNQSAIITTSCIKENQCSTIMPYNYEASVDTPAVGEQIDDGKMCGPGNVAGEITCCLKPIQIKLRNCDTRLIYYLQKVELLLASICIQLPDEIVGAVYLALPPKPTTAAPTIPRPTLPWVDHQRDDKGIVTIEYKFPQGKQDTNFLIESFDAKFRTMIAESLNTMPITLPLQPPGVPDVDPDADINGPEDTRRRRGTQTHVYASDDVKYTGMPPTATGETLQVPIYVQDPESGRVPTDRMMGALKSAESSGAISDDVDLIMERYYAGLPDGLAPVGPLSGASMWARDRNLLIALIVLISICLLTILIALCCLKCRKNRGSWSRADDKVSIEAGNGGHPSKKRLMVVENPLPDSEIMRDESPMMEHDNPAMTSNGGGGHLSKKDDDNGWIVPIDELTKAEKETPEVEDTKL